MIYEYRIFDQDPGSGPGELSQYADDLEAETDNEARSLVREILEDIASGQDPSDYDVGDKLWALATSEETGETIAYLSHTLTAEDLGVAGDE